MSRRGTKSQGVMGSTKGGWVFLLLMLVIQGSTGAPPSSPTNTKRSDETLQFGNQQNKPVSVLDEDALPGAFPSSETIEIGETEKPATDPEEADEEVIEQSGGDESGPHDAPHAPSPGGVGRLMVPVSQHMVRRQPPLHREPMIRDLPPVALASRWRPPSEFYNPHWTLPVSPLYGAVDDGTFPNSRRRRRSTEHRKQSEDQRNNNLQVSLHALRTGHRHKREVHDIRRIRRDLSNIDLDKLRREVDVVELLAMLAKPPMHHNPGYATVTYAPMAPAPPRFAPQPKLFPDYDEEEEDEDEDEDEDDELTDDIIPMAYRRNGIHPPTASGRVMLPSEDRRIWRRSGYGLSAMPGFKRSSFRANTPAPPVRALNPGDVYSLAAMLGAELDPVTHRLRRAAM